MKPWIGVDLDGTLAKHYWPEDGPFDVLRIGEPVPTMVVRVREWLERGHEVRIFTARVGPGNEGQIHDIHCAITAWCREHIGYTLRVTATKDYGMIELWDDRAVRVVANEGQPCCGSSYV